MTFGETRGQGDGMQEPCFRLGIPLQVIEKDAMVHQGLDVIGAQLQGTLKRGVRVLQMLHQARDIAEIVMDFGRVRIERQGLPKTDQRRFEVAGGLLGIAEIIDVVGHSRPDGDGPPNQVDGRLVPADLVGQHPQQVQRVRMPGNERQHLAIALLGLL